jgi:heptose I phosphotransferase
VSRRFFTIDSLEAFFSKADAFKLARDLEGIPYRQYANRETKKFIFKGSSYFLKYHGPVGWKEIFKNLLQFKIPVVGAKRELTALLKLQSIGIGCPEPVGFMSKGWNPANRHSFLITKSLEGTISLEDFFIQGMYKKLPITKRRLLLKSIATICKTIHWNGLNHRDLYLCHFHISEEDLEKKIYLIDLHRAQIRRRVPIRWATKDIGGLFHSIIQFGISETDCYRFLSVYFNCSFRRLVTEKSSFINKSRFRAYSMHMKPILQEIDIKSKKQLPEHSIYQNELGSNYRWIGKKEFLSDSILSILRNLDAHMEKGKVIKKERGHFIVSLDVGKNKIFIKKYQVKNFWHLLRKQFSKSRAFNSWIAVHWFNAVGIETAKPIAIFEKFNAFTTLDSYLLCFDIEGAPLKESLYASDHLRIISARIASFFKRLRWIGFNHGDAKSSNFFFKNNLIAFDLDISRRRNLLMLVDRKIKKDILRIIRSLDDDGVSSEPLSKRLLK